MRFQWAPPEWTNSLPPDSLEVWEAVIITPASRESTAHK